MAPASTAADSKPKRKRQRKRKAASSDESSSSSDDSSSEDDAPTPAAAPSAPSPPSEQDDSSSSDSSSSDSDSEPELRGRRRGRKVAAKQAEQAAAGEAAGAAAGPASYARPYPARSPSPEGLVPNNVPLGQGAFPALRALAKGAILDGQPTGEQAVEGTEEEQAREVQFGEWWRARLVSEFEKDLAPLAAEPALTAPRLALLLSSLTSLSALHTTSSSSAAAAKSIWHHDPATAIDPLAALEVDETGEAWGKAAVGGAGDVEAGAEGVALDESKQGVAAGEGMEVDQ